MLGELIPGELPPAELPLEPPPVGTAVPVLSKVGAPDPVVKF